jgi:cellulose synthase/poly-beta-1,6-N-acetylglucosamine synthase-like glycosyltransferase
MILDVLFYVTMYMSLFVSIFWLSVYYTKKEIQRPFKHVPLTMIIPTYNKAKTVGKTIRSLENQNYKKLKIIVIDDGSTDNTKSVVKKLMKLYKNITYFKKSNTGKASSLNFGLRKVTTPYFGFIDSDTYISKNVLKKMMSYFDKNIACVTAAIRPSKAENILEKIQKIEYAISTLTRKLMSAINSLYYTPAFAL